MYKTVFKTRQGCLPNSLSSWLLLLLPLCFTQCRIFLRGDREFYFRPWCFAPSRLPMAQFLYSLHFEKHQCSMSPRLLLILKQRFAVKSHLHQPCCVHVCACIHACVHVCVCVWLSVFTSVRNFYDWQNVPLASYSYNLQNKHMFNLNQNTHERNIIF